MKEKTVTLPIRIIKEIFRYVPPEDIERIQKEMKRKEVVSSPAGRLLKLKGIASIGGDALEDTERIWA